MIINLGFFVVLELGAGFCQNLQQFLALRALYGIAMGGTFDFNCIFHLADC